MAGLPREQPKLSFELLVEVGETRLAEARVLLAAEHYVGAIYLGGFAVEVFLKALICRTQNLDGLPRELWTHDLDTLWAEARIEDELKMPQYVEVWRTFRMIVSHWSIRGEEHIRYLAPSISGIDKATAEGFLKYVDDPKTGLLRWLRKLMS